MKRPAKAGLFAERREGWCVDKVGTLGSTFQHASIFLFDFMSEPFVRAVEAIYRSAAEPSYWTQALQVIADCFGDVGAILLYGKDDGSFGVIESASLTSVSLEYGRLWSDRDIRAVRSRERGYFFKRDVITDRDVVSRQEMLSDPFYTDLLTRHGLKYFAAAMVSPDPWVEVALSIQRSPKKTEFTDAELDTLARLGPHVERALRLGIRLMDAELSKMGLGAALSRLGMGIFILDSLGRVIFSNPASQTMLGDGLDIIGDKLSVQSLALNSQASEAMKRIVNYRSEDVIAAQRPILVHRRSSNRPLTLYFLPIPMAETAMNLFLTQARVIVLAIDPDVDSPPDPSLIRDILGLTLGEARVAALVGAGQSPREAAEKLGISEETARTTLKRVFAKVGVSRQSELAALLAKLVLR
ncbi:helix-turn-helix transcriptional regulator [Bradyrhizobium sp. UFLA05-112]